MNWVVTKNNKAIKLAEIPQMSIEEIRKGIVKRCIGWHYRVVSLFGVKEKDGVTLYVVLADDEKSRLFISSSFLGSRKSYPAITQDVPSFHVFEREFYEEFGIVPTNHPWLKPVRYAHNREVSDKFQTMKNYPFFKMQGDEVHEVAAGPVHAGIIEPGHFRFMCNGENVYHLEIQLGYQHRGVERLFETDNNGNAPNLFEYLRLKSHLAESIVGDSVIAHTTAYANAMEALLDIKISKRAMSIRAISLELERIAMHIGDLGSISNDIAYLMGNAVFGAARTLVINTTMAICGNRFGRGLIQVGKGVAFDIDVELREKIKTTLVKVERDVTCMIEIMISQASVLSRLEHTGVVNSDDAVKIGMLGFPARSSGLFLDVRSDHPYGIYKYSPVYPMTMETGDVFARTYIRFVEIKQSIRFILEQIDNLQQEKGTSYKAQVTRHKSLENSMVVSMVEGWRGEIVHTVLTNQNSDIIRYKIKDPSFCNWYGLAIAMRNNGISDFPLCNKSFNLSYCGNDL